MKLISDNALVFIEGVVGGIFLTVLWNEFIRPKKKINVNENVMVHDFVADSDCERNKLIMVVRNDLKMGKGKVAAQCSHAAVMAYESCRKSQPNIFADWCRDQQPKIVLKAYDKLEMLKLAAKARQYHLLVNIVQDAGKTQVPSNTKTVLAIGPGPERLINQITGHLHLY